MLKYLLVVFVLVGIICLNSQDIVFAGSDMPYEQGITKLKNSLSGPVGVAIAVIAMFVVGATFIFGGDLTGFTKTLVGVCFAIGVMLGGNALITKLFGNTASGGLVYTEMAHNTVFERSIDANYYVIKFYRIKFFTEKAKITYAQNI